MAGRRLLVIQLDATDPVGRLGDWLTDAGLDLDIRALDAGEPLPADLSEHDGVLVLGGAMGAEDDAIAPYLKDVRSLLRAAVEQEVPTLGVCLGHQLLAVSAGGRVELNPQGPEVGAQLVAKRTSAAGDPLFDALPITPDVIQWHYDAVTRLPAGAVQLASSPGCEQQAFRLGRLAWGIQFHIETTPEIFRSWAEDAHELSEWDLDTIVHRATAAHEDVAEVWQPFAASFAAVVRDPDAVAPGRTGATSLPEPLTDPAAIRAALAAEAMAARGVPPSPLPMPQARRSES